MVKLSHSQRVKVTHYGSISVFSNPILCNVLYVPCFKFNLLYIYKLCKQLNHTRLFNVTSDSLQGLSVKSLLEIGREIDEVYIL